MYKIRSASSYMVWTKYGEPMLCSNGETDIITKTCH